MQASSGMDRSLAASLRGCHERHVERPSRADSRPMARCRAAAAILGKGEIVVLTPQAAVEGRCRRDPTTRKRAPRLH